MPFQILGLWLPLKKVFLGLALTVTKTLKDVGIACQPVLRKEDRDDTKGSEPWWANPPNTALSLLHGVWGF